MCRVINVQRRRKGRPVVREEHRPAEEVHKPAPRRAAIVIARDVRSQPPAPAVHTALECRASLSSVSGFIPFQSVVARNSKWSRPAASVKNSSAWRAKSEWSTSPSVVQNASTRNVAFCACALDIATNAKTKIAAALRYLRIRYFAAQWI